MTNINKGDFVELDYTARITSTGDVFDTTLEAEAKKLNIHNKDVKYKPLVIKVGEGHLVKGLDDYIVGKTAGNYKVELAPEQAFGKKNAKLLRLVSISEFHKNDIQPMPGLEVELDNHRGIVRTVNGGRVIVDFNHPLSSQDITYDITIKGIVTDAKRKVEATLELLQLPHESVTFENDKATITFKTKIPEEISKPIIEEIKKLAEVKDIEFK